MSKIQYYLSSENMLEEALHDTGLSASEIEEIVGRFDKYHHAWAGKLKGQVWVYRDKVQIRHHFKKSKVLWEAPVFGSREEFNMNSERW